MKIGVDLDGVIFDSEKIFRVEAELYDLLELKRNSIIDNREVKFQDRYKWSKQEQTDFLQKYQTKIVKEAPFMPGAKKVLQMLKNDGHELIIITARGATSKEHITITKKVLKENEMDIFSKYFWATKEKEKVCLEEKVDLMIDDSDINCKAISEKKIKTLYFKDSPNFEMKENNYLKTLYNWGEVYRYIKELGEKHEKLIIN